MKKLFTVLLAALLAFSLSLETVQVSETQAATKKYKNCKELNKDYEGGVARTKSTKNKGGKTKYKPYVSKALYDANKGKDRDKDNIACEH